MQEPFLNFFGWGPDIFFFDFCSRSLRDATDFSDYFQVEPLSKKEYLEFKADRYMQQKAGIGFWAYWREHAAPEKRMRRDVLCGVTANRTRLAKYDLPLEPIMGIVDVEVHHLSNNLGNMTESAFAEFKYDERWSQLFNLEHFFSEILGCKRTWHLDILSKSYGFLL